jgi:dihydrofolate reductase
MTRQQGLLLAIFRLTSCRRGFATGFSRLAKASVAEEAACGVEGDDKDVSIGGAGLAAAAIELGLVDGLRMFRYPVVIGAGTPFLPPVTEDVPLDLIQSG